LPLQLVLALNAVNYVLLLASLKPLFFILLYIIIQEQLHLAKQLISNKELFDLSMQNERGIYMI